jgi:hypothetical protein
MLATNIVRGFVDYADVPPLLAFSRQHPEAVETTISHFSNFLNFRS